ncbi:pheromone-regulated protein prm10 [Kickxella alabastrina]|uniref:Pheromone-regulated protein prm10 n=1 Tax=Kickxella alabastrina TaxID=61397 RepID=A0ACC1IWX7_9FUNG|nr:pheromone-regulated protein prm10 [Kickxella alabastrina]
MAGVPPNPAHNCATKPNTVQNSSTEPNTAPGSDTETPTPASTPASTEPRSFNARRLLGSVMSSAARTIHNLDRAPTHPGQTDMMSNIGHIKLKPDPATILMAAGSQNPPPPDADLESNHGELSIRRPGLLSHYLQLINMDRNKGSRQQAFPDQARTHTARRAEPQGRSDTTDTADIADARESPGGMWLDIDARQPRVFYGLRRRKPVRSRTQASAKRRHSTHTPDTSTDSRPGSGFFAAINRRAKPGKTTATSSGIGTPLADTPGVPFRHLSEALPWATSQRQMASAYGTPSPPHMHTRRPSMSSLAGDVSTLPQFTIDSSPIKDSFMAMRQEQGDHRRQNIVHAIDMLLLHQRFLVLISKALMMYGSPLHHLEDNLTRTARLLDLEMTASAFPGLVMLSFDDSITHTSETKLVRCSNGWDMHRLDQTNQLLRRVVHGNTKVKQAVAELELIMTAPPIYAWYWQVLNWGVISWSLCLVCFGGSWKDSGISLALGLIAGIMNMAAGKFSGYTNFFEVSVSIVMGILSAALASWGCFGATSLSATVVLLPGLVMTTGVIELSSRHMIAGTVRIFYALLLAFIIAYGLLIGVEIYNKMAGLPVLEGALLDLSKCEAITKWSWFGTFPAGIVSISILVNIHWKHWTSVTIIAGISYGIFWLFKFHLGLDDLAPVVASFVLGLASNMWSKVTGQTAYMILLPGEMFLVPGSVGVRGFSSMLSKDGGKGAQLALQMITTCLSIMMGLFASSFVVYPRGKQHSAMLTV